MSTEQKNIQDMERELALMLATLYAQENDETPQVFVFDSALIPTLHAGETVEVKVRRTHRRGVLFPSWDLAGVVGYVTE
jgi:hypothetical protein